MKKMYTTFLGAMLLSLGLHAQIVNIPDANFKAYLVGNTAINTNGDSEIQVSEAQAFTGWIDCPNQGITDLTGIEAFVNATQLYIQNNQVSGSLDLTSNSNLILVRCANNNLTELFLTNNTQIFDLRCSGNQLSNIDVTGCTGLTNFWCSGNQLTSLDVSSCISLIDFQCNQNQLTSLDISNLTDLTTLQCQLNQITSLDASNNQNMALLRCQVNQLTSLSLANSNNINITNSNFNAINNPNLTCIEVDDATWSTANWSNIDATASFSEDCQCINTTSSITIETACGSYTAPDGQVYSQSGNYTAIIPNAAGCDSIISINLQQVVLIYPYIEHSVNNGVHSLLYNYGGDFQWVDCNNGNAPIPGETSNFFTPTASGLYALEITVLGCTTISNCLPVTVNTTNLVANEAQYIRVYPNPAMDQLNIELSQPTDIYIMNALGNTVFSTSALTTQTIDVAHFAQGVYFVKAGNTTQRFVKQ